MLFKQLAEMIGIVITHAKGNILDAGILFLIQKLLRLFHAHPDQMVDRRVTGFAFKDF